MGETAVHISECLANGPENINMSESSFFIVETILLFVDPKVTLPLLTAMLHL